MPEWFQVRKQSTEGVLLQNIKRQINQIQSLSGVTQADFQLLYAKTIERFAEYLAKPNKSYDGSAISSVLNRVILILKKRQGFLLPLGADSEIAFREREVWTFAIFSAALFEVVDTTIRLDVAKAILPLQGFAWLHRNTKLFESWKSYLQDNSQLSIFHDLISKV